MIISARPGVSDLFWTLMITSASNRGWPDDVSLEHRYAECGLPEPSVIRVAKVSTVEAATARPLGKLPADIFGEVKARVAAHLGF